MDGQATSRLVFSHFDDSHIPGLFEMENDPEVMRYINNCPPVPWKGYTEKIHAWFDQLAKNDPRLTYWAAHERLTGEFVGWFHLRPNARYDNHVELGYRLRRNFWGRGYATEGSRALLDRAFNELELRYVMAQTLEGNLASRRVMEKAGMQFECSFVYPPELLPFWDEAQRRAVRYAKRANPVASCGEGEPPGEPFARHGGSAGASPSQSRKHLSPFHRHQRQPLPPPNDLAVLFPNPHQGADGG